MSRCTRLSAQWEGWWVQPDWNKPVPPLKDNFTHWSVLVGEDYFICEKSSMKLFVAPEEAAFKSLIPSSDVTQWVGCIVGNVGTGFLKRKKNVWNKRGDIAGFPVAILTIYS